jgi:hypothetical protein
MTMDKIYLKRQVLCFLCRNGHEFIVTVQWKMLILTKLAQFPLKRLSPMLLHPPTVTCIANFVAAMQGDQ